jgi:hypothetical protein
MRRTYTVTQKVWGEFHGERHHGSFELRAGVAIASDPARLELLEHLVGLGLAKRGRPRTSPAQTITPEV